MMKDKKMADASKSGKASRKKIQWEKFFFFRNGSVFELICKCLLLIAVIPWVTLIIVSLILDKWLDVVAGSDLWIYIIFFSVAALAVIGLVLAAAAVLLFCLKRRKQKKKAAPEKAVTGVEKKQGEDKEC